MQLQMMLTMRGKRLWLTSHDLPITVQKLSMPNIPSKRRNVKNRELHHVCRHSNRLLLNQLEMKIRHTKVNVNLWRFVFIQHCLSIESRTIAEWQRDRIVKWEIWRWINWLISKFTRAYFFYLIFLHLSYVYIDPTLPSHDDKWNQLYAQAEQDAEKERSMSQHVDVKKNSTAEILQNNLDKFQHTIEW